MDQSETPHPRSLPSPPTDGITSLSYLPSTASLLLGLESSQNNRPTLLLSTSWDGRIRLHDTFQQGKIIANVSVPRDDAEAPTVAPSPVLDHCVVIRSDVTVYASCLDGRIVRYDVRSNGARVAANHPSPSHAPALKELGGTETGAKCICTVAGTDGSEWLVTGGWDGRAVVWDMGGDTLVKALEVQLPGKAFSMDSKRSTLVVATSGRRICIYNLEIVEGNPKLVLVEDRESSLKYQTRTLRIFPDGTGMALGSIEGRVAIEYLEEATAEAAGRKKYAFKCHRINDTVYPVNAIAFHPVHGTLATGGADGTAVIWDAIHKKRLTAIQPKFPTSVAALAFNADGTELAVASSYTFEGGERDVGPKDEIYVREVRDVECRPKKK